GIPILTLLGQSKNAKSKAESRSKLDGGSLSGAGQYDRIGLRNQVEASGASEKFVEAFEILGVERIVNVGAKIKRQFPLGKLQIRGAFGTNFRKVFQAEHE